MIVNWAIGGGIIGLIFGIFNGDAFMGLIGGALIAVAIRKWIFRNLWM